MGTLTILGCAAVLAAIGGGWIAVMLSLCRKQECDAEWFESFSIDRYRPMERLLNGEDEDFLRRHCGYDWREVRRVRAERRRIFRAYLKNYIRDFNRLHSLARVLLLEAREDRPELAAQLVRIRVDFLMAVTAVECRLVLHAAGMPSVDVSSLVSSLDRLRLDCGALMPAHAGAAA